MKWSMDTHKYMSEITRTALQIIAKNNINSDSPNDLIKSVEDQLADAKIYKDKAGASGRIRRALFTYFRSYHCMDEQQTITEMGKAFIENKISIKEFSFWYLINYKYEKETIKYYPIQHILAFFKVARSIDPVQAFLTPYDFEAISELDDINLITEEFVKLQIQKRNQARPEINERAVGYDVWSKMLLQSDILSRDERNLVVTNWELCNWILNAYSSSLTLNNGNICCGPIEKIPLPQVQTVTSFNESYQREGNALCSILFDDCPTSIIDKYIIQDKIHNVKELCLQFGLNNSCKGFYKIFSGYEHIIGYLLLKQNNLELNRMGKAILNTEILDDNENQQNEYEENDMTETKPYTELNYTPLKKDSKLKAYNRIIFGAPGTGKSFQLKEESTKDSPFEKIERVTFHPDYSYGQFVGSYKPVSDDGGKIRYEYVPGPFMRTLVAALESGKNGDAAKKYLLIVEEINRAKVAAVFGDMFQLLDRTDEGDSVYEIQASEDVRRYLAKELGGTKDNYTSIKLPNNMYIWATMNSADQGVFPMDTAFKRRWEFTYIGINEKKGQIQISELPVKNPGGDKITWDILRMSINKMLLKECKVNEDKLLGPFFISGDVFKNANNKTDEFFEAFNSKVLMYLFEDAGKMHQKKLFAGIDQNELTFSKVCEEFKTRGTAIFGSAFQLVK